MKDYKSKSKISLKNSNRICKKSVF